jgi:hypothetical protein
LDLKALRATRVIKATRATEVFREFPEQLGLRWVS